MIKADNVFVFSKSHFSNILSPSACDKVKKSNVKSLL